MGIRITGGVLRGRVIASPQGLSTRPTASMVRLALFNILQDVSGASVLDLYAGSGIMGIEALSRGARHVVAVEKNRAQALLIKKSFETLSLSKNLILLETDVKKLCLEKDLPSPLEKFSPFDLIYVDPPFKEPYPDLRALGKFLSESGVAVFECPSRNPPEWLSFLPLRRYGESSLAFLFKRDFQVWNG